MVAQKDLRAVDDEQVITEQEPTDGGDKSNEIGVTGAGLFTRRGEHVQLGAHGALVRSLKQIVDSRRRAAVFLLSTVSCLLFQWAARRANKWPADPTAPKMPK